MNDRIAKNGKSGHIFPTIFFKSGNLINCRDSRLLSSQLSRPKAPTANKSIYGEKVMNRLKRASSISLENEQKMLACRLLEAKTPKTYSNPKVLNMQNSSICKRTSISSRKRHQFETDDDARYDFQATKPKSRAKLNSIRQHRIREMDKEFTLRDESFLLNPFIFEEVIPIEINKKAGSQNDVPPKPIVKSISTNVLSPPNVDIDKPEKVIQLIPVSRQENSLMYKTKSISHLLSQIDNRRLSLSKNKVNLSCPIVNERMRKIKELLSESDLGSESKENIGINVKDSLGSQNQMVKDSDAVSLAFGKSSTKNSSNFFTSVTASKSEICDTSFSLTKTNSFLETSTSINKSDLRENFPQTLILSKSPDNLSFNFSVNKISHSNIQSSKKSFLFQTLDKTDFSPAICPTESIDSADLTKSASSSIQSIETNGTYSRKNESVVSSNVDQSAINLDKKVSFHFITAGSNPTTMNSVSDIFPLSSAFVKDVKSTAFCKNDIRQVDSANSDLKTSSHPLLLFSKSGDIPPISDQVLLSNSPNSNRVDLKASTSSLLLFSKANDLSSTNNCLPTNIFEYNFSDKSKQQSSVTAVSLKTDSIPSLLFSKSNDLQIYDRLTTSISESNNSNKHDSPSQVSSACRLDSNVKRTSLNLFSKSNDSTTNIFGSNQFEKKDSVSQASFVTSPTLVMKSSASSLFSKNSKFSSSSANIFANKSVTEENLVTMSSQNTSASTTVASDFSLNNNNMFHGCASSISNFNPATVPRNGVNQSVSKSFAEFSTDSSISKNVFIISNNDNSKDLISDKSGLFTMNNSTTVKPFFNNIKKDSNGSDLDNTITTNGNIVVSKAMFACSSSQANRQNIFSPLNQNVINNIAKNDGSSSIKFNVSSVSSQVSSGSLFKTDATQNLFDRVADVMNPTVTSFNFSSGDLNKFQNKTESTIDDNPQVSNLCSNKSIVSNEWLSSSTNPVLSNLFQFGTAHFSSNITFNQNSSIGGDIKNVQKPIMTSSLFNINPDGMDSKLLPDASLSLNSKLGVGTVKQASTNEFSQDVNNIVTKTEDKGLFRRNLSSKPNSLSFSSITNPIIQSESNNNFSQPNLFASLTAFSKADSVSNLSNSTITGSATNRTIQVNQASVISTGSSNRFSKPNLFASSATINMLTKTNSINNPITTSSGLFATASASSIQNQSVEAKKIFCTDMTATSGANDNIEMLKSNATKPNIFKFNVSNNSSALSQLVNVHFQSNSDVTKKLFTFDSPDSQKIGTQKTTFNFNSNPTAGNIFSASPLTHDRQGKKVE